MSTIKHDLEHEVYLDPKDHKEHINHGMLEYSVEDLKTSHAYYDEYHAGDVVISNRQLLHGSFANTSDKWRVTVNMGCLPYKSVLGARGGGIVSEEMTYDAAHIAKRSRVIGYAIDARRQKYPDEKSYEYKPFSGQNIAWDKSARASLHDYSLMDMSI